MLAPGEPLLLGRGHHLAVDHQGGGRVVEHRVHAEDTHRCDPLHKSVEPAAPHIACSASSLRGRDE
jgi:hypothetical protein